MVDLTSSRQVTGQQKDLQPVFAQVSQATAGDEKQTDAGTDAPWKFNIAPEHIQS